MKEKKDKFAIGGKSRSETRVVRFPEGKGDSYLRGEHKVTRKRGNSSTYSHLRSQTGRGEVRPEIVPGRHQCVVAFEETDRETSRKGRPVTKRGGDFSLIRASVFTQKKRRQAWKKGAEAVDRKGPPASSPQLALRDERRAF